MIITLPIDPWVGRTLRHDGSRGRHMCLDASEKFVTTLGRGIVGPEESLRQYWRLETPEEAKEANEKERAEHEAEQLRYWGPDGPPADDGWED